MTYYHHPTGTARNPRGSEQRTDTGQWVSPPNRAWTDELAALCGFAPIVDAVQPADTDTHTHDRTVVLVDGTPTVTWHPRAKTAAELAAVAQATNVSTLEGKARTAVGVNNTFLAIGTPTNAQTLAQVKSLTRQMSALIRLSLRGDLLDNTDGT